MAAPRLSVKDSSSWKTVEVPYIKENGSWEFVHNIWVKNGGSWKLAHKTARSRYFIESGSSATYTSNFFYTVPSNGTRYLQVTVQGQGGGGGGGVRTGGAGLDGGHLQCPNPLPANTVHDYATGGVGGNGGWIRFFVEVDPGDVFHGEFNNSNITGGAFATPMDLHYAYGSSSPVGTTKSGSTGGSPSSVTFKNYPYTTEGGTSVTATGGAGGTGGTVTVSTRCVDSGGYWTGYTVTTTNGSAGANGTSSVTNGSRLTEITGTGSSGAGTGGAAGDHDSNGGDGSTGSINIIRFKLDSSLVGV
tara:strand:+ start:697 stop:1605 length:909 start_codon:yes stop_codon:yes gene_type:complete